MKSIRVSVAVLGGGPAGSALARRLALLGHSVALVERAQFPRAHTGESLSPSVIPLFNALELRDRIEAAGFLRPCAAIIHWAGAHRDSRAREQAGFQVDRPRFDALFLDSAKEAGVQILQPAIVESIEPAWRLRIRAESMLSEIYADYLADATGRACFRGGLRVSRTPLLAMWAYWRIPNGASAETRVESGLSEWFWGAPLPDGSFNATVFFEPKRLRNSHKAELYKELLSGSKLMQQILATSQLTEVSAADASSHYATEMISPIEVKVGEAAYTIDPLSSQGIQAAIGSALHAAACVHTILVRGDSTNVAMEFYRDRQMSSFRHHDQQTSKLYREAAAFHGTPFWLIRSTAASNGMQESHKNSRHPLPMPDWILTPSPSLVATVHRCLRGDFIEEQAGLTCEESRDPLIFLGDINVFSLWQQIKWPVRASIATRIWAASVGTESALKLLAKLWQGGYLETMSGSLRCSTNGMNLSQSDPS